MSSRSDRIQPAPFIPSPPRMRRRPSRRHRGRQRFFRARAIPRPVLAVALLIGLLVLVREDSTNWFRLPSQPNEAQILDLNTPALLPAPAIGDAPHLPTTPARDMLEIPSAGTIFEKAASANPWSTHGYSGSPDTLARDLRRIIPHATPADRPPLDQRR